MSDYTPTTEDVLSAYLYDCHRHRKGGLIAEFDRWLEQVKAEAWEEGHEAAAMRVPEGVWHDTAAPRPANPYKGTDS